MLGSDTFRPYAPPTSKLHISPGQLMIAAAVLSPFLLELLGGAGSTSPQKSVTSPPFVFNIAVSVSVFAPALLIDSASRNTLYMQCEPCRTSVQFHCLSSPPQYLRNCVDCNPVPPSSIFRSVKTLTRRSPDPRCLLKRHHTWKQDASPSINQDSINFLVL